ncbi:MAG: S41 family peptidase [Burkholderiales bacterium]|nr:S41 family peptidase [Bacteroidia bacterium]
MKSNWNLLKLFFIIQIVFSLNIYSQTYNNTFVLNKAILKDFIDTLAFKIDNKYVLPEKATAMSNYIKKRYKEGYYDKITDPNMLADVLNKDILSIHNDEHFYIEYNPKLAKELSVPPDSIYLAEQLKTNKAKNYGFKKIEILNGNIGYIDLSYFASLNPESEKTANAAFQVLSNCKAIIIDLRYGMGGQPEMVCCIAKHFLKENTHILQSNFRSLDRDYNYYSEPDDNYTSLYNTPLYILTSYKTFSAAELLSYSLQNVNRVKIVGEQTRGGAHSAPKALLYNGFIIALSLGKATSKATNTNWERVGVTPDIKTTAENSLEVAELDIFENYFKHSKDSIEKIMLKWQLDLLKAKNSEPIIDSRTLKKRVGVYSYIDISMKNNNLYYERIGKTKFPLVPMTQNKMRLRGNDSFIVEFIVDRCNNVKEIITYNEDGRIEHSVRN